jgi:HK97 family phage portal protein
MGLFSRKQMVEAQVAPQVMGEQIALMNYVIPTISRKDAMSVPALARCRNLISGVVGSVPLEYYKKSTGEMIASPKWIEQLSPSQPSFVTLAWICDSLLMYGQSFLEIVETYQEDGRPSQFEWVANTRVTYDLDIHNNYVTQYYVDGVPRPMSGLTSLITIQAQNDGILSTGARTIQAAIDAHRAASIALATPSAVGYLKNNGADLPPAEVQGLISAWKRARQNSSVAYLTSTLSFETVGFSPKDMGYTDAIQNLSTEISRLCNIDPYYVSASMNQSMTYSNVIEERKQLVALSLQPYFSAIESRLSMNDVSTAGHYVKFALDDTFLRTEPMERLLVLEKMLGLGLITTEQAMEMEDLSPNGNES